ncbi:DUF72 domain-containing protein [Mucilaginibacter sp. Bleaf8]|uniref:DUF72 domain-containing protein n=1 Tax=Mucilaginibacter sp. Bleaf8 TaxID=2834430 RepID=UPI001BCD438F|nr:DUF72 domain-containing protein [Mucilaginibacter sp. Bleaf8]MBS7563488.1 DUF72 domain-containing protein [Mucilaginibacter sp. Bleaf8]
MEFGKVPISNLATTDFTLPPDPELTTATLRAAKLQGELKVHVGCSSWGQKVWKGNLFPAKIKDADFLAEYVKHFNFIELNATHYRMWEPDAICKWRDKAAGNPDFKFSPKFNQIISHVRRLKGADEITTAFYESMLAFEEKLGPMFLQLNENFSPNSFTELKAYLQSLPHDIPVFTELRHKDWFAQPAIREDVFELMHNLHIGAIITDTAGRRDVVHMYLPTPHAYIRFVGNALHPTDYLRIDAWVERIKQWADLGLQSLYVGMHQSDERTAPVLCDYLIQRLNQELGLQVARPKLLPVNGTLF